MESGKDVSSLKWNILQAIHMLVLAWNRITPVKVANCFPKDWFPENTQEVGYTKEEEECEAAWVEVKKKFDINETSFSDFVSWTRYLQRTFRLAVMTMTQKRKMRSTVLNATKSVRH
ncbi:hypothetical protein PR048_004112 [Dryococelus australis]|uniref:Uncharacterized protein n=1 Tax=Dryococelus australis TaxID=614101 RepID=A0ABQ9I4L7_9NEOP|nr:hypothetical protein PR048_004112 [Dryococelus australis]